MKKLFMLFAAVAVVFSGSALRAADNPAQDMLERVVLYVPNRVLDVLDMFSISLGIGPVAEARLMGTRLADCGAGISGVCYKAFKGYNRQYGAGVEDGWYWSFISVGEESYTLSDGTALMTKYSETRTGVPLCDTRTYDFFTGPRDYWAIGGALGCLVDGELYIHPVEWVDCVLGLALIDIRGDDLTFDDFQ